MSNHSIISSTLVDSLTLDSIINCSDLSSDGKKIAIVCDRICYIWNTIEPNMIHKTFRIIARLNNHGTVYHRKAIDMIRFTLDGEYVITFGIDHHVVMWSLQTKRAIKVYTPQKCTTLHKDRVMDACFDMYGTMYTCSVDGTILLWELHTKNDPYVIVREACALRSLDIISFSIAHSNYTRLCVACADGSVRFYDNHGHRLGMIHPDSQWQSNMNDGTNGTSLAWLDSQKFHMGALNQARISPDGRHVASASMDRTCKVWNSLPLRQDNATLNHSSRKDNNDGRVPFEKEQQQHNDGGTHLQNFNSGLYHTLRHERPCEHIIYTPDSQYIITTGLDATVRIWSVDNGSQVYQVNLPKPPSQLYMRTYAQGLHSLGKKALGRLYCILQNRLVVMDIYNDSLTSLDSLLTQPSYNEYQSLFHYPKTPKDIRMAIARGTIDHNYLYMIIPSNISSEQLRHNLYRHNLDNMKALRIVADALEQQYTLQSIYAVMSTSNDQQADYFFHSVLRGDPLTNVLSSLGCCSSTTTPINEEDGALITIVEKHDDGDNVVIVDENVEQQQQKQQHDTFLTAANDDDDDDKVREFVPKLKLNELERGYDSDYRKHWSEKHAKKTKPSPSSLIVHETHDIPLALVQEGYHTALNVTNTSRSSKTTGRLKRGCVLSKKPAAPTTPKPTTLRRRRKCNLKQSASYKERQYTSIVAHQIVPNALVRDQPNETLPDRILALVTIPKSKSQSEYAEMFDPAKKPVSLRKLLKKLGDIRVYGDDLDHDDNWDNNDIVNDDTVVVTSDSTTIASTTSDMNDDYIHDDDDDDAKHVTGVDVYFDANNNNTVGGNKTARKRRTTSIVQSFVMTQDGDRIHLSAPTTQSTMLYNTQS